MSHFPPFSLHVTDILSGSFLCSVIGEKTVRERDHITVELSIVLRHRRGGGGGWVAHAPRCDDDKAEGWVLVVCGDAGQLVAVKPVPAGLAEWKTTLQFRAPRVGLLKLNAKAICSAYVGADVEKTVEIDVQPWKLEESEEEGSDSDEGGSDSDEGGADSDEGGEVGESKGGQSSRGQSSRGQSSRGQSSGINKGKTHTADQDGESASSEEFDEMPELEDIDTDAE